MVDDVNEGAGPEESTATAARTRRRTASRPAGPPPQADAGEAGGTPSSVGRTPRKRAAAKASAASTQVAAESVAPEAASAEAGSAKPARKATRRTVKAAAPKVPLAADEGSNVDEPAAADEAPATRSRSKRAPVVAAFVAPVFIPPTDEAVEEAAPARRGRKARPAAEAVEPVDEDTGADDQAGDEDDEGGRRRRRRRGGRRRRRGEDGRGEDGRSADGRDDEDREDEGDGSDTGGSDAEDGAGEQADDEGREDEDSASRRRRRRRRRGGDDLEPLPDEPANTVVKVRQPRSKGSDEASTLKGSTRLEAKKQRRREGREAGRRRAPILTEAEFLARREAVNRIMAVRQSGDRTQIAVLEDGVLVEHYVTRGASSSMVGNVYLGRVQNVLPSMEAAFVDIGRGRNAVLYAGEVNWDAAGLEGQPKRIEFALKSGDTVLVQVTKDPVGQKGARLTSQISLPGRFLVYVPDGSMTGISRKLPDTERSRLKGILKRVMPADAGVIVRTAAEGAAEDALEQDVQRLSAQWEDIFARSKTASPPTLLSSEPDLAIKVVRDIFNEDVSSLVVSGSGAWSAVHEYVTAVAPDLADRLEHWVAPEDLFGAYRVDEQLAKALDRKVWLPSGGSLVIDRTEAMTVVDVNTGKFTGQGGNLEQTVTRNNLEAAEEIVRQLRLRDIGGIIVVDFIDMVLESNRDLVLRRLIECLGRDRTKHQVAEVTSLGLVQMTRKRIGSGLLESFSVPCEHCAGRGIRVSMTPVDHDHPESPKHRRPANAVDPADVAARALAEAHAHEDEPGDEAGAEHEDEVAAEFGAEAGVGFDVGFDVVVDVGAGVTEEGPGPYPVEVDSVLVGLDDGPMSERFDATDGGGPELAFDLEEFDTEAPLDEPAADVEAPLDQLIPDAEAPLEAAWEMPGEPDEGEAV